uniref:Uncharacterized protein n=1 Tax=Rhipicephalus appendiculatus TaxID=34631 RepID=A0A131YDF4_RHIAP
MVFFLSFSIVYLGGVTVNSGACLMFLLIAYMHLHTYKSLRWKLRVALHRIGARVCTDLFFYYYCFSFLKINSRRGRTSLGVMFPGSRRQHRNVFTMGRVCHLIVHIRELSNFGATVMLQLIVFQANILKTSGASSNNTAISHV